MMISKKKIIFFIVSLLFFSLYVPFPIYVVSADGIGDAVIGEIGVVSIGQMQWHNITFRNTYDSIPVVIASPTTNNRGSGQEECDCCASTGADADDACDGILPVINWVGTTGFNCTIMYDNGTSAVPPVGSEPGITDNLSYWVINTSAIEYYDWIDAGVKDDVSSGLTGDNTDSVALNKVMSGNPAVFVCAQTYSQEGDLPAYYWVTSTGTAAFTLQGGVHYSTDDCNAGHGHEEVGWLAIDLDDCLIEDFEYGSADISNSVWTSFSHSATEPNVLVMQNSDSGSQDPEYCGARDLYGTPEFHYCEQDGDGICNTHNAETVYWVCLDNTTSNGNITSPNPLNTYVDTITPYNTSTNPLTITASSIGGTPDNVTLYYRYNNVNTSWGGDYENVITTLDPDFRWILDSDYTEEISGHDGSGSATPDWVDTIITGSTNTKCGDFTPDDEMLVGDDPLINTGTGYAGEERSISVWFNADTIPSNSGNTIWSQGGSSNSITIYTHNESGTTYVYATAVEGGSIDYARAEITTGVTYHLGATYDFQGDEIKIYINGVLIDTDDSLAVGTSLSAHSGNCALGGQDSNTDNHTGQAVSTNFDGRIADFVYWSDGSVLSQSDFEDIYEAGSYVGVPWIEWEDDSNPDESSPWSWNFDFSNGTGYYQFYSIGQNAVEGEEISPTSADAICNYTGVSIAWQIINDTYNGVFSNSTSWYVIDDTYNGIFSNSTDWTVLDDTVSGVFSNSTDWMVIDDTVNGVFSNSTSWSVVDESFNGVFSNATQWLVIDDTISGVFTNATGWSVISDDFNGVFTSSTDWMIINESYSGVFSNSTSWYVVDDSFNGIFTNTAEWNIIDDTVNGIFISTTGWSVVDVSYNGMFTNTTPWSIINNSFNGIFTNSTVWSAVNDTYNGVFSNSTFWYIIDESYNGVFSNSTLWVVVDESYNGVFINTTSWIAIDDTFSGEFFNCTGLWHIINESYSGMFTNTTNWAVVDNTINGVFSNMITWSAVEDDVNGSFYNRSGFMVDYSYGIFYNISGYIINNAINGSFSNTSRKVEVVISLSKDVMMPKEGTAVTVVLYEYGRAISGVSSEIYIDIIRQDETYKAYHVNPVELGDSGVYRYSFTPRTYGYHKVVASYSVYQGVSFFYVKHSEYDNFSMVCERIGNEITLEEMDRTKLSNITIGHLKEQKDMLQEIVDDMDSQPDVVDIQDIALSHFLSALLSIVFLFAIMIIIYYVRRVRRKKDVSVEDEKLEDMKKRKIL